MAKNPNYDVLLPEWRKTEPFFAFPARFRNGIPARFDPWRVAPDDKRQPVHKLACTCESLNGVHPNAIAIGSPAGPDLAKTANFGMIFMGGGAILAAYAVMHVGMISLGAAIIPAVALIACALTAFWCYRVSFRSYDDWPILFNRKTREVIYFPVKLPHFLKFWQPVRPTLERCRWDDVKVRSYKYRESTAGGASFHSSFNLTLLWGGDGGDPRALNNYVNIGYQGYFEDEVLFQLWEHIRRYMEEGGPPINPGEQLRQPGRMRQLAFPPDVIATAGGPALSAEQVAALEGMSGDAAAREA